MLRVVAGVAKCVHSYNSINSAFISSRSEEF